MILKWPECSGIGGRNQAEWVADLFRNRWPEWSGIRTCPLAAVSYAIKRGEKIAKEADCHLDD